MDETKKYNMAPYREIIDRAAEMTDYTREAVQDITDALCVAMRERLKAQKRVVLQGVAYLNIVQVQERTRYNPYAGNHMRIPGHPKIKLIVDPEILKELKPEIDFDYEFSQS